MTMKSVADVAISGKVICSPIEVVDALAAMGLNIEDLHNAIAAGELDRDSCTANNPPTDAGSRAHGTTVRMLREALIPRGWAACDDQNFSTVVAEDGVVEIAVATGDEATGDSGRTPRTKNRKGELVLSGVQRNQKQLKLFKLPPTGREKKREAAITWILLRYRDHDVVRCELSVPLSVGDDDRVDDWGTRIILPDLELGGGGGVRRRNGDSAESVDDKIDISIVRKTG